MKIEIVKSNETKLVKIKLVYSSKIYGSSINHVWGE